jgi:hypothetical protein
MTVVLVSTKKVRRLLCLFVTGGCFLAGTLAGCGGSENQLELSPEAKKSVLTSKVGDPSKFIKPGQNPGGKRR